MEHFLSPISVISKIGNNKPLVESDAEIYNFDRICKSLFMPGFVPTSADGLALHPNSVELIEFKSGFVEKISKQNFDKEKAVCESKRGICEDYWREFRKSREVEKAQLIDSLRMKAIESIDTLEHVVFPECDDLPEGVETHLKLTIVVDVEETEIMEDILAELAGKHPSESNPIQSIRQAMKRLLRQRDFLGHEFYFDEINVVSAQVYQKTLSINT